MQMPRALTRDCLHLLVAVLAIATISACSDDQIVYRDRAPFNSPADATAGFLGYYDASTKQTTCGNCHSSQQASWKTTKHASAYANLNSSTAKQPACFSCHTLTGKGNAANATVAGYDKVKDSTYFDVQCESCHGAGLKHVEGVGQGSVVRPLAKLSMTGTGTCGDCHSGTHQPFAEEWASSGHANLSASRATNPSCWGCHEGRHALERWGVEGNFVEKADPAATVATTCSICHNPHGSSNPSQLRFPVTSTDPEQNLCIKCHLNRAEPTVTASTPHGPQGAMLLGFAGWRPPGFVYDTARIFGSHATTKNPKLCAGCHVGRITVTDKATGAFSFQATGHLMRPVPCLDATGKPIGDKTCAYTEAARSWQTCAASGCHANAAVAVSAFTTIRSRMKFYTDQLWRDVATPGTINASPTDLGLLPTLKQTRPTEWSTTDNTITPAEGVEFNTRLCGEYGASNSDNSKGVHNPFLCEALLIASINYLRSYYALPASTSQAKLAGPIGGEFNGSMRLSRTAPK
ncbi:MAG: cytochrome c3 family protein [Gemmatimonas sp.]